MNSISATSKFDIETMSRGRYWFWRTNTHWWIISLVLGTGGILLGLYLFIKVPNSPAPVVVILAGLYFILRYWITGLQFRRALKKHPQFNDTLNWVFNEEGLKLETEHSSLSADWKLYLKTYTVPDGFLLYPQKRAFNWIPRSAFRSDEDVRVLAEILARKTRNKKI